MSSSLVDLTERLVPISDFSQGKAGKIFSDVCENNNEYIILKNNQPTAMLVSIKEYKELKSKIAKMERFLEDIENIRLLKIAQSRNNGKTSSLEDLITEEGFSVEDIINLAESIEFE
ncbi:MAG: type II toxin-antitoxin system Phd/YefM family antitoxin [Eubacteriales bacterium]